MFHARARNCAFLASIILVCPLASCQQDNGSQPTSDTPVAAARKDADALEYVTADRRKQRLSGVEYDLNIDLQGGVDVFAGEASIRYELTGADADLTLDFAGGTVRELRINDATVPVTYNGAFLTLPAQALREGSNSVFVAYEHAFGEDGTGLHRFVDPEDHRTYLYTYLWPYYANRVFPSFDQPNLKAKITLTVTAPEDWIVVSTSTGEKHEADSGTARWQFGTTPEISTYAFSLHAGPYRIWEDTADGMPIRLMARQSLAEFVAVDEWLEITKRGLAYYGKYFDIPYAFHKYDQLIVPDFNIGAMENIAAVTFTEKYVQRQPSDRSEREDRASVILHEMAHMWFGNLVTHDWWNGLWLNESFATQMAAMAMLETTTFKDTWHGFFTNAKQAAYARDGQVTTHPIEMPIDSTNDFFTVFDAITYQKGSSVLKQLAHYTGEEGYRRGVSAYLKEFSYNTTELSDFIGHIETSTGVDLGQWTDDWLYKAGYNTLSTSIVCDSKRLQEIRITQTAPDNNPYLRTHQTEVALYSLDENRTPVTIDVITAEISRAVTVVEGTVDQPCPALVNPNFNDWTFAKLALDDQSAQVLRQSLGKLPEPLDRSMFLAALFDRAMAGDMPIADYVDQAIGLAETEDNIRVQQQISGTLIAAADMMQRLRPETDAALARLLPALEAMSLQQAGSAAGNDLKRTGLNTFLGVVASEDGLKTVGNLLDGTAQIPGIEISPDLRWRLLTILSAADAEGVDERLKLERASDPSDFGAKSALTAAAARPDPANKSAWLAELQNPETVTGLARQRAVMAGLFPASQTDWQLQSLDQVLAALPDLSETADPYFMASYASVLLTPMCRPQSVAILQAAIAEQSDRLKSTPLRFLREAHQADRECLALRSAQG
ncbi:MAG: aminopeptidase N [Woeseia sp.]